MKWMITASMAVALAGCTVARMADCGTAGESDRIDVTNVPGWANGTFRLGEARGSVRSLAAKDAIGWGPDVIGPAFEGIKVGLAARYGTIEFMLDSKDVGGRLEGSCRYARTEVRDHAGFDLATPARPLALRCAYRVDDRPVGELELQAVTSASADGTAAEGLGVTWLGASGLYAMGDGRHTNRLAEKVPRTRISIVRLADRSVLSTFEFDPRKANSFRFTYRPSDVEPFDIPAIALDPRAQTLEVEVGTASAKLQRVPG